MPGSRAVELDTVGMACEGAEIFEIAGEHGAARLCGGDDYGIDYGTLAGEGPQCAGSPGETYRQFLDDVTGLEQTVHVGVGAPTPRHRFGQHDRRHYRRP